MQYVLRNDATFRISQAADNGVSFLLFTNY